MNDTDFWRIIGAARDAAGADIEARAETLERELDRLPLEAVQAFQRCYDRQLERANRWPLRGAAYLLLGGCSDMDFRYFLDWLVSEGQEVFERALDNPDSLAPGPNDDIFQLDSFGYVAQEVYESKEGEELERDFPADAARPFGSEWDEDVLLRMFPRLARHFEGYDMLEP